ncbi:MAG TPA: hypothetical protein VFG20_23520, partial [Planctomycetaceae bacterium]|nr:hypothetical protein [Planctomycetaceae bacterium]
IGEFQRAIEHALEFVIGEKAATFDQSAEFGQDFGPTLDLRRFTAELQFITAKDHINVQSVPQSPQIAVARSEQAANIVLIAKPYGSV